MQLELFSALSCHGNPVQSDTAIAQRDDAVFLQTLKLAKRLEIATVITFSGCPGGGPQDATPNWSTAELSPDLHVHG